ncbi:LOW QUALITY PROTEIN: putative phospholipase B-like 2 [Macrobrachium rosenbergii]|uniref:LOW QUALITY PROTEIN: putative phospholipase B-like 2 n=1 Tax=Macrobrachium rosenbergii TaxID=79674 RepID=UPI0034D6A30D
MIEGLFVSLLLISSASAHILSITYDGTSYEIHDGVVVDDWVARGNFTDTTFEDGFAYLELQSSSAYDDKVQAYAAGLAEGALTHEMIYNHYRNTMEGYCTDKPMGYCERLHTYLDENDQWLQSAIAELGADDPVFHQSDLILLQIDGMNDGYNRVAKDPIEADSILMMNLMGDLDDLELALDPTIRDMTSEEWVAAGNTPKDGRCSGLIKVLPDNSDIYVSQVTWNHYSSMLRILKKYTNPFRAAGGSSPEEVVPGHTISFSSYPGMLFSGDDFHIISSGLVSLETTIGNSNPQLWQYVQPKGQILEWMRTIIANRMATDGESWVSFFSGYNSGTYNNQWMVVDYNLFQPGEPIRPGTLVVAEQIPSYFEAGDETDLLVLQSYFGSYNIAFYENVFNLSGCIPLVESYGDWFTYNKHPRALIFARDHTRVTDMDSMYSLMRYNDYKNDPLSKCDCDPPYSAENGISARSDLNPVDGKFPFSALEHRMHGGTDVKITNYEMAKNFLFLTVNGPTSEQQPVFRWSEQAEIDKEPHYGHPDEFKFSPVTHEWVW